METYKTTGAGGYPTADAVAASQPAIVSRAQLIYERTNDLVVQLLNLNTVIVGPADEPVGDPWPPAPLGVLPQVQHLQDQTMVNINLINTLIDQLRSKALR